MTIVKHEFKTNLKTLLIWSITIGLMIFSFMLMFPMMEDSLIQMEDQFSNMKGFSAAFGLDKLSIYTAMGFYGSQVGVILSLGGALFAALLGAGMLSKEEGGHTAEFLLTSPISRANVVFQKLMAIFIIIFTFELISITMATLSFILIKEPIDALDFLLYHLAQLCLHIEIACICFGISAFTKKINAGMGLGIALIFYFVDIMVKAIPDLDFLKYISPFYYSGAGDIFSSNRIDAILLFIGIMVSIITVIVGYIKYSKKDIAA